MVALKQKLLEAENLVHSTDVLCRLSAKCCGNLIVLKAQSAVGMTEVRNKGLSSITDSGCLLHKLQSCS